MNCTLIPKQPSALYRRNETVALTGQHPNIRHPNPIKLALERGDGAEFIGPLFAPGKYLKIRTKIKFSLTEMNSMIDEMITDFEQVLSKAQAQIPTGFPEEVSKPIFEDMEKHRQRLLIL